PVRIFLPQLPRRQNRGLIGAGQPGGEGQDQNILSLLEDRLHRLSVLGHVDRGGGGQLSGPEHVVEQGQVHLPVIRIISVGLSLNGKAQGQNRHSQLLDHLLAQVGGGIGNQYVFR